MKYSYIVISRRERGREGSSLKISRKGRNQHVYHVIINTIKSHIHFQFSITRNQNKKEKNERLEVFYDGGGVDGGGSSHHGGGTNNSAFMCKEASSVQRNVPQRHEYMQITYPSWPT